MASCGMGLRAGKGDSALLGLSANPRKAGQGSALLRLGLRPSCVWRQATNWAGRFPELHLLPGRPINNRPQVSNLRQGEARAALQ
jgi:hypothetical protein